MEKERVRSCQHNSHHGETSSRGRKRTSRRVSEEENEEEMSPTAITHTDRLQLLNFYAKKIRERKRGGGGGRKGKRGKVKRGEREIDRKRGRRLNSCLAVWLPLDSGTSAISTDSNRGAGGW